MKPIDLFEIIFYTANTSGALLTCWYAICGLNACTRKTPLATRLSFAAIAIGAFAVLLHPPDMDGGGVGAVMLWCGVALGFVANRKKCVCLNCPARAGVRRPEPMHHDERMAA
jgi:hypothetical protein